MDEFELKIEKCLNCGFCCKQAACAYGEWDKIKKECKFLTEPNDNLQRFCSKYDEIKTHFGWQYYPAFGAGCGSTLFNLSISIDKC